MMESTVGTTHLLISSTSFSDQGDIPVDYTCDGKNINPEIIVDDIPAIAKSLVVVVDDPDAPGGSFTHWLIWNIRPKKMILENSVPGIEGKNSFGKINYMGPCPPSGVHRYLFKVYALDALLNIKAGSDRKTLEQAMQDHIVGSGILMGRYMRRNDGS